MAPRYSLGTLLAIVIPISAVLLLSLLLLLVFCCCYIKQKSHIKQLNKQVSFKAQNERYNLRKKAPSGEHHHPDKTNTKPQVPWYRNLLCCCSSGDVFQPEATPSAQEKGLHSGHGTTSRSNDFSRHNSQKKASSTPQKHEGRHEMKFLSGQFDNNPGKAPSNHHRSADLERSYRGDPRASKPDRSRSGPSRHPPATAAAATAAVATKVVVDAPDKEVAKHKKKHSRTSSGADGLEYGTPKGGPVSPSAAAAAKRNITKGSPEDILPPAPLNLNSQGIILTDEEKANQSINELKYFEKYQAEALEQEVAERDAAPREVLARDPMGRNAISRQDSVQNSSIYPESPVKPPVEHEDRFVNDQYPISGEMPGLAHNRNSTQYKWLDSPINLARLHRGENKLSMVASFVEPLTPISPVDQADQERLHNYASSEVPGPGDHSQDPNTTLIPGSLKYTSGEDSRNQAPNIQGTPDGDAHTSTAETRTKSIKSEDYRPAATAAAVAATTQGTDHSGGQQAHGHNKRPSASYPRTSAGPSEVSASFRNPYANAPPQARGAPQPGSTALPSESRKNQGSVMSSSVDGNSQSGDNSDPNFSPNVVDHSPHWKPSPIVSSTCSVADSSSPTNNSGDKFASIPLQLKNRGDEQAHAATESGGKLRSEEASQASELGTLRQSRIGQPSHRTNDYARESLASASYGSEWHRNRPGTDSSVGSEYTHGTYATAPSRAPSRAPYDTSREKEPKVPVHNNERILETPWRSRRSQSTSSRASSLLFSVSEKGYISSGGSHRKKGSISSSTRTKHKDPSKFNKPLPKTPPGGGKAIPDVLSNTTYDTLDTDSPSLSQAGAAGPISLPLKNLQGFMAAQPEDQHPQPIKNEDGVVANMGGMLFHAVFPYNPALEDELPLAPREVVKVYQVFDDGWCFARKENPLSGPAHGICPKVCLANISV